MQLYAWSGQRAVALRQYGECERILKEELGVSPEEETAQIYEAIKENRERTMADSRPERFRLERKISSKGSFGEVWLATDTLLDRFVAIKCPKVAHDPVRRERFLTEARILARLNHPNITQIYDALFDEGENRFYLVMEYVDGKDLAEIIRGGTPLPLDWVLDVATGILRALSYAHGQGIVHRDVKPANVMIADEVKLTDFGLANLKAILQRRTDFIVGTVAYLAPEQIEGRAIDGRADLYSLGVTLFEMITGGRLPFDCADRDEMLKAHLDVVPIPLSTFAPTIPPVLEQVIMRLLAKDPEDRYPSAEALMNVLDSIHVGPKFSNLPILLTPFVGREAVLAEIADRLGDPACRLLTLVGPGGCGKTRLAVKAAAAQLDRYPHGVFFVSLAPLDSVEAIVPTVAEALGFSFYEGGEPRQQLLDYLRQKSMLLVLDNFEHLLDGVVLATDILKTAIDVKVLATSRERLNVQGEHLFPVAGMDFPALTPGPSPEDGRGEPKDIAQYSAVKLFLHSARRTQPGFEPTADNLTDVVQICRLVEGMPLGIELAAGLVQMLTPAEIATEISQSLDVLETELRDVPERQRSMRAAFDHSWRLLTEREREVFQGLSVFRGGFTRQAVQQVTGALLRELMALVNKSLLQRTPMGRYEVHELLRQYAVEKLDGSPAASEPARDRHSAYYAATLQQWAADLRSARQQAALAEIEADSENACAAWNWAVERGKVERLDQAMEGLCRFYVSRWRYQEGEAACRMAAEKLAATASGRGLRVWAKILTWQSVFSRVLGRTELAGQLLRQSLALLERPELADQDIRPEKASTLLEMGRIAFGSDREEARRLYEQSLALYQAVGDQWGTAHVMRILGGIAGNLDASGEARQLLGKFAEAHSLLEESVAIYNDLGFRDRIAFSNISLGGAKVHLGRYEQARAHGQMGLTFSREIGYRRGIGYSCWLLGCVALAVEAYAKAQQLLQESVVVYQEIGQREQLGWALAALGYAAHGLGNMSEAQQHLYEALQTATEIGAFIPLLLALPAMALLLADQGEKERAVELYALASRYPFVANSRWFEEIVGKHIAAVAATLPPDVVTAAQERGKARDLEATVAELLVELGSQGNGAPAK